MILEQHATVEAAHLLPFHAGKCKNLHGHSYSIEFLVTYSDVNNAPLKNGMLVDFGDVKDIAERFDHTYFNEHPEFVSRKLDPTAENFAVLLAGLLAERLWHLYEAETYPLFLHITVRVREGLGNHWVSYTQYNSKKANHNVGT